MRPSEAGYGVFMYSGGGSYCVREMDVLAHPYKPENAVKVFKRRVDAEKAADAMNSGKRRRR